MSEGLPPLLPEHEAHAALTSFLEIMDGRLYDHMTYAFSECLMRECCLPQAVYSLIYCHGEPSLGMRELRGEHHDYGVIGRNSYAAPYMTSSLTLTDRSLGLAIARVVFPDAHYRNSRVTDYRHFWAPSSSFWAAAPEARGRQTRKDKLMTRYLITTTTLIDSLQGVVEKRRTADEISRMN